MKNDHLPLIPRHILFGNPEYVSVTLSPDGQTIAYLAPQDGVLNVWIQPSDNGAQMRPVTRDKGRGVRAYFWAYTNQHLLYIQDQNGDENWRLYCVDLQTNAIKDLTPFEGVQARVLGRSEKYPTEMIMGLNHRSSEHHDVYRLNIISGELALLEHNEGFVSYTVDWDLNIRFADKINAEGGRDIFQKCEGSWKPYLTVPVEDEATTSIVGFDKTNQQLYLHDSRGRNTAALIIIDIDSKKIMEIGADPRADIGAILLDPVDKTIEGYSVVYDRERWTFLNPAIKKEFDYLSTLQKGEIMLLSRSSDNQRWIIGFRTDDGPVYYYYYDRDQQQAKFLFTSKSALENLPLVPMHTAIIPSRDGLSLVSYLTLPRAEANYPLKRPSQPWPMVLLVHGGPWARDTWGYNSHHQWLANRGYAVLSVNFRASTGFGKNFLNAGNGEWGAKMQDDLTDAVQWAIEQGVADPKRIAIMGASYGGYAVLAGLTLTPELYACGVDIVGPSNLMTLIKSIPPYWKPLLNAFKVRLGADSETAKGQQFLKERSPLAHAHAITKPLLIGQGANDPRVNQEESDQIVHAMQAKNLSVIYVLYPEEGHGFAKPENRISFNAITEVFFAKHLEGRCEPVGHDFDGAHLEMKVGAESLGLEVLATKAARGEH